MANIYDNTDIENEEPLYDIESESLYDIEDDQPETRRRPVAVTSSGNTGEYDDTDDDDDDDDVADDAPGESQNGAPGKEDAADSSDGVGFRVFLLLLKVMCSPTEGWKSLKRNHLTLDQVAGGCFYPLLALASVTEFASMFYDVDATVGSTIVNAFTTFMVFFFGYFTVLLGARFLLPKVVMEKIPREVAREYVMVNMSTLAIFRALSNCLPMFEPVIVFLPLWTIYIIFKGVKILRVPTEKIPFFQWLMTLLIIGAPMLWDVIISRIL